MEALPRKKLERLKKLNRSAAAQQILAKRLRVLLRSKFFWLRGQRRVGGKRVFRIKFLDVISGIAMRNLLLRSIFFWLRGQRRKGGKGEIH
jgi:hypothetical protein